MSQASEYAANVSRILQGKADAIAEGKRANGALIGNTIATIGSVVPQQIQQVMKANAEKRKKEQIQGIFKKHGQDLPSAIGEVMQIDPDLGMDLTKRYQDAATAAFNYKSAQWKAKKDEIETIGNLIGSAKDQDSYTQALVTGQMMGLDLSKVPQEYSPQIVEQYNRAMLTAKERLEMDRPKAPEAFTLSPGQTRFDASGKAIANLEKPPEESTFTLSPGSKRFDAKGNVVAEVPQSAGAGGVNVGSFEDYVLRYAKSKGKTPEELTPADIEAARKAYQQSDDRPRITVQTGAGGGLSPTQESNVINRLAQQWKGVSGPAVELSRQANLMDVGMKAARRGDMAQGSQVVLVTFQKVLDPPSVVRESEYMRSAAGQSLINRVRGSYDRLAKGGAGITLPELEKFATLAREAVNAQSSGYLQASKERIGKTADRYKIPRELVFEDFDFTAPQTAPSQPAAAPAAPAQAPAAKAAPTVGSTVTFSGKRYRVTAIKNGQAQLEALP